MATWLDALTADDEAQQTFLEALDRLADAAQRRLDAAQTMTEVAEARGQRILVDHLRTSLTLHQQEEVQYARFRAESRHPRRAAHA